METKQNEYEGKIVKSKFTIIPFSELKNYVKLQENIKSENKEEIDL